MAYKTYKRNVSLLPGQTLGFTKGKGYYAKTGGAPAPYPGGGAGEPKSGAGGNPYAPPVRPRPPAPPASPRPTPPPAARDPYAALTQAEIDKRATELAQAGLTPQQEEIRRQQKIAADQATADEAKQQGLALAGGKMMAELGPGVLQGYLDASKQEGDLGQGLATGVAGDVAGRVAADQEFMKSQGQQGGTGPDTAALHDVVYGLNGEIPGNTFAEEGAAANQWQVAQAPIALAAGRDEIAARMAQARKDNDGYAQQLLQLAATEPGLKAQALDQLNQYELDKANYRESVRTHTADIASQKRQDATSLRSLKDQEAAAGLNAAGDAAKLDAEYTYKYAALRLRSAEDKAKLAAATAQGKRIDSAASKVVGHVVYRDGTEDASIKVAQSGGSTAKGKAIKAREGAASKARVTAFTFATKLLGTPVKNKSQGAFGGKGGYIAAPQFASIPPGKPGAVYHTAWGKPGDVATTDRPGRAARTNAGATDYADAQTKVWAAIDGDGLMSRYGYSREQVMTFVRQALARSGWKRK